MLLCGGLKHMSGGVFFKMKGLRQVSSQVWQDIPRMQGPFILGMPLLGALP